jgi:chemotaxis protein histidine kinase CheA
MADKSPFDEEFSPEEEAALQDANAIPPAEEEGEGSVEEALAAAGQAKEPDPAPAEAPKPGEAPAAEAPKPAEEPPAQTEEQELAAFLEKHKDKTPEELQRLLFQQTKRASREAADNRRTRSQVSAIAERARAAQARREQLATAAPDLKEKFRQRVGEDPDAAVSELFEAIVDQKLQEADSEVQAARVEEAIQFADAHIPDFGTNWPGMHKLANEIGYSDDEVNAIDDGRPLIALYLASHTARLMKAGIMDRYGNINLEALPGFQATPIDPRLAAPDPQKTLGGGAARGARGAQTVEQQLAEIANMSDEEFNKLDPAVLDALLKAA